MTVNAAPTITSQPASLTILVGNSGASFSVVAASGTGTKTYQWQVQTGGAGQWANVTGGTGATTASYTTPTVTTAMNGNKYRVVVRDANSVSVTSNGNATLTVSSPTVVATTGQITPSAAAGDVIEYSSMFTFGPSGQTYENFNFTASDTDVTFTNVGAVLPPGQVEVGTLSITATHKTVTSVTATKTIDVQA